MNWRFFFFFFFSSSFSFFFLLLLLLQLNSHQNEQTGELFACKQTLKANLTSVIKRDVMNEKEILSRVGCSTIVQLHCAIQDENYLYMVCHSFSLSFFSWFFCFFLLFSFFLLFFSIFFAFPFSFSFSLFLYFSLSLSLNPLTPSLPPQVMTLLRGGELGYQIDKAIKAKTPLSLPIIRFWSGCLFHSLSYLHAHGIVHCDIKVRKRRRKILETELIKILIPSPIARKSYL